jgi:anti-anti-sigma factor
MNITQRVEGNVTVFTPEGRIDSQAAIDMDKSLQASVTAGNHKLVVDMSEVEYISSAGLRAFAAVLVKCRDEGGDMKLGALNKRVSRVFKIIGFDLLMSIHDTSEAAINDFSSSSPS